MRIAVVDQNQLPLMPTTPARARKWVESGKAIKRWSDSGQFYVQLTGEPSGRNTQDIVIGVSERATTLRLPKAIKPIVVG